VFGGFISKCGYYKEILTHNNSRNPSSKHKTRGVSHYGLAISAKKYLKAKEELWKF
jgi:hypothetical protein